VQYIDSVLETIEDKSGTRADAYSELRQLGMNDFSTVLWSMPDQRFSHLSSVLPVMATEDVQQLWTGYHGYSLLSQSISFMRAMAANYASITGKTLNGKRILDYGCGYGRLLRLAAFYSDDIYGVDPWPESIRQCNEAGLSDVALSDYLPNQLPVPQDLDFAYAFSVFTHLSENAARAALAAIHRHLRSQGVLCITIRPVEYWRMVYGSEWDEAQLAEMEQQHQSGFAFHPHSWMAPGTEEVTYGDSSMTMEWLTRVCLESGWTLEGTDRTIDDPVQRFVFLRKV
jgi:SAM-dependent methyltransferase